MIKFKFSFNNIKQMSILKNIATVSIAQVYNNNQYLKLH